MARLDNITVKRLTLENFRQFPVWTWDEGMELRCPVSLDADVLPMDLGDLFIKASLRFAIDLSFDGYIVGLVSFFCFSVFSENQVYSFNLNLPQFVQREGNRLFDSLGIKALDIFPVSYKTDFFGYNGERVCGEFVL